MPFAEKPNPARRRSGFGASVKRWWNAEAGTVTIELAFVIIMLTSLTVAAFDFGRVAIEKTRVTNAASAGAQYGIIDLITVEDETGMETAAYIDADDVAQTDLDFVHADTGFCQCPESAVTASCDEVCIDDNSIPMYVRVTVRNGVDLLFPYPGVSSPIIVEAVVLKRKR
jgi:Flp pilus assembly protein TadG